MLKQLIKSLLVVIFFFTLAFAQENPEHQTEETAPTTEVKSIQPDDSTTVAGELEIWNKVCPVKGDPIDEGTPTVEYNGKIYGFCCPGCDTKFAKNPEKYAKNLNEDGTRFIGRK